ncbi:glycoprotein-N-acetylgalactosamine 3-beta-galactosyltransferase 1-like [Branchiostoma lanceolatum]|uniref:glycoprotein-N-acetylgalactosamine 3-beta-galactosyltransferase 1-like n=1 Tax=Branchiostoma lanceolatum TaxID=7740 RepID=UPI003452807E
MALENGSTKRAMMTFTVGALFGGVIAMLVVSSEVLRDGVHNRVPVQGLGRPQYIRTAGETFRTGRDQVRGDYDTENEAWMRGGEDNPVTGPPPPLKVITPTEFLAPNQVQEESRVRVLCWILTDPENHDSKALPAYDTWASKCDRTLFITTKSHDFLPTVVLNVTEGRESLLQKSIHAFKHVYQHHLDEADWFFKADDDTYVIMENLRHFLSDKDPDEPVYYGFRFNSIRPDTKNGYMSGGAGYVLSKEAVRRLVTQGMDDPRKCRLRSKAPEDLEIGRCLEKAGVMAGDSRDEEGRQTFHCLSLQDHVLGNLPEWLHRYSTYPVKSGPDCCSKHTISFHYTEPIMMYVLDFAIHHVRPYGHCDRMDHT